MKNSELSARIADYRRQIDAYGRLIVYDSNWMVSAIETLLAREAEVLDMLPEPPDGYMSETQYARAQLGDQIRAILNPEENSNG